MARYQFQFHTSMLVTLKDKRWISGLYPQKLTHSERQKFITLSDFIIPYPFQLHAAVDVIYIINKLRQNQAKHFGVNLKRYTQINTKLDIGIIKDRKEILQQTWLCARIVMYTNCNTCSKMERRRFPARCISQIHIRICIHYPSYFRYVSVSAGFKELPPSFAGVFRTRMVRMTLFPRRHVVAAAGLTLQWRNLTCLEIWP